MIVFLPHYEVWYQKTQFSLQLAWHYYAYFSWNTSYIGLICLQRLIKSGFIYRIVTLASWSGLLPPLWWTIGARLLWFFTAGDSLQDTKHGSSSGAECLWPTLCHCGRVSGPLYFIYNTFSPILHYPDPARVGPAFHWSVSTFPLSRRRLVGSAHKERAANPGPPLISLAQYPLLWHLHRDGTSQSGVSAWEDFDPSTQWRREL